MIIQGGRFVTKENSRAGGRGRKKSGSLPRRGEIITQEMVDPTRTNGEYRMTEGMVVNARTSGVFWRNTGARDCRWVSGTSKKTLRDRASNMFSSREQVDWEKGDQDTPWNEEEDSLHVDPG